MARTTAAAVQLILGKDYDTETSPSLDPFIDTAAAQVSRVATCATAKGVTLSSTELELIERWLAAYAYVTSDAPYTSRSTLSASGSFDKDVKRYKEMAESLDPSGCVKSLGKRASAIWLGRNPVDQTDYDDRNV